MRCVGCSGCVKSNHRSPRALAGVGAASSRIAPFTAAFHGVNANRIVTFFLTGPAVAWRLGIRLWDQVVREDEKPRRNRQAEGLGSRQVDDQLEERRPLNGKIGWLRALQNLIYVVCRTAPVGREAR